MSRQRARQTKFQGKTRRSSTRGGAEALPPDAMIGMPPTTGTSMDDYGAYLGALAAVTRRPVLGAISHQHQEFRGP